MPKLNQEKKEADAVDIAKKCRMKQIKDICNQYPEFGEMVIKNEELIKENAKLLKENEELCKENVEIEAFANETSIECEKYQEELEEYKKHNISKTELEKIKSENKNMSKIIKNYEQQGLLLKAKTKEFIDEYNRLKDRNEKLEQEMLALRKQFEEKRNFGGVLKDKTSIGLLKSENKELKNKIIILENKLSKIGKHKLDQRKVDAILELNKKGFTCREIAKKLGIGSTTAYNYVKAEEKRNALQN